MKQLQKKEKKTTITISDEVAKRIRIGAIIREVTIAEYVSMMVELMENHNGR